MYACQIDRCLTIYLNELKSERMENENKEVINLTDEELKEVTGGAGGFFSNKCSYFAKTSCVTRPNCEWKNGKCVDKD